MLAEGTQGHLTGAAIDYFDLAGPPAAALGARRQGGLGGLGAARPRDPHDGMAAAQAREVERVRRQLHLPDGRGQGLHRLRRRASTTPTPPSRSTTLSSCSRRTRSCARSSTAASASPGARRRFRRAATGRCRAGSRCPGCDAGDGAGDGQHPRAQGHPLRDARRACTRPRRSSTQLKQDSINFEAYDERVAKSVIGKDMYRSRNMRQPFSHGFFVGGAMASRDDDHAGRVPRRACGSRSTTPRSQMVIGSAARDVPEARRQVHVRQALVGVRVRQRDARRRAEPHPGPEPRAARGRADLGLDVPGAGLRDPRGAARGRERRPTRGRRARSCRRTACSAARSPPRAAA